MVIIYVSLIIVFGIIILFSSKHFSPIPYFPTNKKDLSKIIQVLELKNNQTVIDLGAGDGIIIFKAAEEALKKHLNAQFVAIEINPVLILFLNIRRLLHPNKRNIKIVFGDMFKMKLNNLTFDISNLTFYLYISPWFLEKVSKKVLTSFPNAKIISYMYPIKSLKKKERIIKGKNSVFIYNA